MRLLAGTCKAVAFDAEQLPVARGAVYFSFVCAQVCAVEGLVAGNCKKYMKHLFKLFNMYHNKADHNFITLHNHVQRLIQLHVRYFMFYVKFFCASSQGQL